MENKFPSFLFAFLFPFYFLSIFLFSASFPSSFFLFPHCQAGLKSLAVGLLFFGWPKHLSLYLFFFFFFNSLFLGRNSLDSHFGSIQLNAYFAFFLYISFLLAHTKHNQIGHGSRMEVILEHQSTPKMHHRSSDRTLPE